MQIIKGNLSLYSSSQNPVVAITQKVRTHAVNQKQFQLTMQNTLNYWCNKARQRGNTFLTR